LPLLIRKAEEDFSKGSFRSSGLAGALRQPAAEDLRKRYLNAFELILDLTYLLSEVLLNFHRIGDGLGDYGMIRTSTWLHPFLDALQEKVLKLRKNLELISQDVDEALVLAPARGRPAEKPLPSDQMCARGHEALQRSISGRESHAQALSQILEELKARSAPERLPYVRESLGDACLQLQTVFSSTEFRERVGTDAFSALPAIVESVEQLMAFPTESADVMADASAEMPRLAATPELSASEDALPRQENPLAAARPIAPAQDALEKLADAADDQLAISDNVDKDDVADKDDVLKSRTESTTDTLTPPAGLNVLVWRLVSDLHGFRRHDARMLSVAGGQLHIFHRSSRLWVKTVASLEEDVVEHHLLQGGLVLAIFLRRPKTAAFKFGQDSKELKLYFFEFQSRDLALEFKMALGEEKSMGEVTRGRPYRSWGCMSLPQRVRR